MWGLIDWLIDWHEKAKCEWRKIYKNGGAAAVLKFLTFWNPLDDVSLSSLSLPSSTFLYLRSAGRSKAWARFSMVDRYGCCEFSVYVTAAISKFGKMEFGCLPVWILPIRSVRLQYLLKNNYFWDSSTEEIPCTALGNYLVAISLIHPPSKLNCY